jgi:4-hydroxy-3-methylbut-2-enyl diphosphate reductase IspH
VQNANELYLQWFEDASTVGITAGTSTPDSVIDAVEQAIVKLATHKEAA